MSIKQLSFQDEIAQLCYKQFQNLSKSGKPKENEWTILSCVVLEDDKEFKVISLGTGTKCIGCDKMSSNGDILNDSHAEVICRRAFIRYIYEQILMEKSNLFIFNSKKLTFDMKLGVKFHFFSTHVPCGDAAIFPKQDVEYFGDLIQLNFAKAPLKRLESPVTNNANKKIKLNESSDTFRTGAKCLDTSANQDLKLLGANYHVTGVVRTKPGRGTPTLSVSCSDKIAKWCHLGVQGALLSILLSSPIYFASFTISGNTPYNEQAMKRALFTRLGNVQLESPYTRNEIILGQSTLPFLYGKMAGKNPCPASISWINLDTERQLEVSVDGRRQGVTKKRLKTSGALKICKLELFRNFVSALKHHGIPLSNVDDLNKVTYKEAKILSKKYQNCWSLLQKNFKTWTKKNDNLINFSVS